MHKPYMLLLPRSLPRKDAKTSPKHSENPVRQEQVCDSKLSLLPLGPSGRAEQWHSPVPSDSQVKVTSHKQISSRSL